MQIHEISEHNTKFWVSDDVYANFNVDWFDQQRAQLDVHANTQKGGRQGVIRLTRCNLPMVLRHYCRGGVPAKLIKDLFIFSGYKQSRAYKEMHLLNIMQQANLPVPRPIAARCQRYGMVYSADILIIEIANTKTLVQRLCQGVLDKDIWLKIGSTIKRFHDYGIEHVDLNANNILINAEGDVFLIDFDRCKQREYAKKWSRRGIQRLARSLDKEKNRFNQMCYEKNMFEILKRGYEV